MNATSTNLSSSLEDYLEAIFNLTTKNKVARSRDIAEVLNVAKPSVTGALKSLSEKGLVNYKPYGYITLTSSGIQKASAIARKHDIIKFFLTDILGVDEETAQQAACEVEHSFGPEIISRLLSFVEFVGKKPENDGIIEKFLKFYENNGSKRCNFYAE